MRFWAAKEALFDRKKRLRKNDGTAMTYLLKRIVKENHASPILSCHFRENLLITQSLHQINVYDNQLHTDLVSQYNSERDIKSIASNLTDLDLLIFFASSYEINIISISRTRITGKIKEKVEELKFISGNLYAKVEGKTFSIDLNNFKFHECLDFPDQSEQSVQEILCKIGNVECFDVNKDLAVGLKDGRVLIYSLEGDLLHSLFHKRCSKCIRSVAIGNGCVVAVGDDCIVWRWDLVT